MYQICIFLTKSQNKQWLTRKSFLLCQNQKIHMNKHNQSVRMHSRHIVSRRNLRRRLKTSTYWVRRLHSSCVNALYWWYMFMCIDTTTWKDWRYDLRRFWISCPSIEERFCSFAAKRRRDGDTEREREIQEHWFFTGRLQHVFQTLIFFY